MTLHDGATGRPETPITNYQPRMSNIPEERRSY